MRASLKPSASAACLESVPIMYRPAALEAGAAPFGHAQAHALHAVRAEQVRPLPAGDHQVDFGELGGDGQLLGTAPGERAEIGIREVIGGQNGITGLVYFDVGIRYVEAQELAG